MDLFWTIYLIDISKHINSLPAVVLLLTIFGILASILMDDYDNIKVIVKIGFVAGIISTPISLIFPSREALALMYVADTVTIQDIKELLEFIKNVK